ncbi:YhcN/YlaJ family sporulation lipoprotein [Bacillus safensis]|uniref:YhcN/YlaJ family sporulation lipoprotein n=1 Tax=Bacillus safensis TaxID=561879 RepID=UPI0020754302|nr:YhcN/YlaJ family sporulation lipoprotein [Bacillus safensis]MCY7675124.1 YhcN/YlaJ family sporulation lipoprotein [Bacillus safensis]MCY7696684.1 YhcN/YlaJ family sporulation lipoprotein [Bacillus safensis]MEC3626983.1 YhcN/YlaJ family sporulation lipoprotein [Bacillus safensis]USD84153.1 YhcN/YlaJ family sporulation lipoprotein [Bacillus safensis]
MRLFLTLFMIQTIILLGACQQQEKPEALDKQDGRQHLVRVSDSSKKETNQARPSTDVAQHLVNVTEHVADVNDATAIVIGRYAVVGIDVKDDLDRSKVETIKYSVAKALRNDPEGANAVVVADPDTVSRLKEMGKEIQAGRPVSGIMDELAAIVGRVMPEMPRNEIDRNEKDPTNDPNNQLKEHDQKQLEKNQNDQSNHHMNQKK